MSWFLFCINRFEIGVMDGFFGFNCFCLIYFCFLFCQSGNWWPKLYLDKKQPPTIFFLRMELPK